jgi:hypothetical protein
MDPHITKSSALKHTSDKPDDDPKGVEIFLCKQPMLVFLHELLRRRI